MGFENRKSARVQTNIHIYFWADGSTAGAGIWGQALNLSETGLAFLCDKLVDVGETILLEFSVPGHKKPLRIFAQVVHAQQHSGGDRRIHLRVTFLNLEYQERQLIRHFVLQLSDPKLAAVSGWGTADFQGVDPVQAAYRELSADEQKKWLEDRTFISLKEATYLKKFQAFLEFHLGNKAPETFKLTGSRGLKEHGGVWVELNLAGGQIQVLGKVLWCRQEQDEVAQSGLTLLAFQKSKAIELEKGF
jgi:hypothetical protein